MAGDPPLLSPAQRGPFASAECEVACAKSKAGTFCYVCLGSKPDSRGHTCSGKPSPDMAPTGPHCDPVHAGTSLVSNCRRWQRPGREGADRYSDHAWEPACPPSEGSSAASAKPTRLWSVNRRIVFG
jgi:hypothetical protein